MRGKSVILFNLICIHGIVLFVHGVSLIAERAELLFYNKTILGDAKFYFGKYNRTTSALNATFRTLTTLPDANLLATISGDQFYHNEYRFTGQKLTVNVCEAYELNVFGIVEQLKSAGLEIDLCHIKPARFELRNFVMDSKYYPDFIPESKWRVNVQAHHKDLGQVFQMRWDLDIKNEDKIY